MRSERSEHPPAKWTCTGLKLFFKRATPKLDAMARLVLAGHPAAEIRKKSRL